MSYASNPFSTAPYSGSAGGLAPYQVTGLASTTYGDFERFFHRDITGLSSTAFGAFDSEQGWTPVDTQHVLVGLNSTAYGVLSRNQVYHLTGLNSTALGSMTGYFLGLTTQLDGLSTTSYGEMSGVRVSNHNLSGLWATQYGAFHGIVDRSGNVAGLSSTRFGTLACPAGPKIPGVYVRSITDTVFSRTAR